MVEIFSAKLRQIGNSVGLLIPQKQITELDIHIGDEVNVALLTPKKNLSCFGIAKNFKAPFVRDKTTRDFGKLKN